MSLNIPVAGRGLRHLILRAYYVESHGCATSDGRSDWFNEEADPGSLVGAVGDHCGTVIVLETCFITLRAHYIAFNAAVKVGNLQLICLGRFCHYFRHDENDLGLRLARLVSWKIVSERETESDDVIGLNKLKVHGKTVASEGSRDESACFHEFSTLKDQVRERICRRIIILIQLKFEIICLCG